jgi:hypothetical protein
MKHLAIAFLLLFALQSSAQVMVIHRKGSADVRIPIADIAKITFQLGSTGTMQPIDIQKIKMAIASIMPNPFSTKIEYTLEKPAMVSVRVFDMQGKAIRTMVNAREEAGSHSLAWNTCDDAGQRVSNASYIVNVVIDGKSISKTLFIVR